VILEHVRSLYLERAAKRGTAKGNPTGSQLGTCCAQLQQLVWRDRTKPELLQPRAVMTFEMGDEIEAWLSRAIGAKFPGLWGLRGETFYCPLPFPDGIPEAEILTAFAAKIGERLPDNSRRLWGTVVERFVPPKIEQIAGKLRVRGVGHGERDWRGLCLEPRTRTLWVPVSIDGVVLHKDYGLTLVEAKSMSNWAFRRALVGDMEYRYRAQLLGSIRATGFGAALWLAFRKETMHAAEVAFARAATGAVVTLTALNGQKEAYHVKDPKRFLVEPVGGGAAVKLDRARDGQWEIAEVEAPWSVFHDDRLLEDIRQRVFRVILSGPSGPWYREAGPPSFTCSDCAGTGVQKFRKGTAIPLKEPKPCGACGKTGFVEERELPAFPCGYCSVAMTCWAPANVTRTIDARPHLLVRRADYERSGLTFVSPEPTAVALLPEETEEEAAVEEAE
jgi:hypothetical protein